MGPGNDERIGDAATGDVLRETSGQWAVVGKRFLSGCFRFTGL